MNEKEFNYTANIVMIDAAVSILSDIIPCDKINPQELSGMILTLRTIRKEINDSYEITEEEEPKNTMIGAPPELPKDEEGDSMNDKPLNFEGVH